MSDTLMNRRERRRQAARDGGWQPWCPATPVPKTEAEIAEIAAATGTPLDVVRTAVDRIQFGGARLVKNNIYQVNIGKVELPDNWPPMTHLSIKRLDKAPLGAEHYRDLQRIKAGLVSPECEAVEVYPAESRLVDTANQFHLWCIDLPGVHLPLTDLADAASEAPETLRDTLPGYSVVASAPVAHDASGWPGMTRIRLRKADGRPLGTEYFRDLQRIKNLVVGDECEAVELYPAHGVADPAGWHTLWAFQEPEHRFPFGFSARLVVGKGSGGAVQQPFRETRHA